MPSTDRNRTVLVAVAVVALVSLLYSVLILAAPLAWFGVAIPLVFLYLSWRFLQLAERFVRAYERIADAKEREE